MRHLIIFATAAIGIAAAEPGAHAQSNGRDLPVWVEGPVLAPRADARASAQHIPAPCNVINLHGHWVPCQRVARRRANVASAETTLRQRSQRRLRTAGKRRRAVTPALVTAPVAPAPVLAVALPPVPPPQLPYAPPLPQEAIVEPAAPAPIVERRYATTVLMQHIGSMTLRVNVPVRVAAIAPQRTPRGPGLQELPVEVVWAPGRRTPGASPGGSITPAIA